MSWELEQAKRRCTTIGKWVLSDSTASNAIEYSEMYDAFREVASRLSLQCSHILEHGSDKYRGSNERLLETRILALATRLTTLQSQFLSAWQHGTESYSRGVKVPQELRSELATCDRLEKEIGANLTDSRAFGLYPRKGMLGSLSGDELEAVDDLTKRLTNALTETDAVASALRASAGVAGRTQSTSSFTRLRDGHRRYELALGVAFLLSVAGSAIAVTDVLRSELDMSASTSAIAVYLFHKLLVLSAVGVIARTSLHKHSLERNLRIIYDHRISVLHQYTTFEAAISSANESEKDKLRLEIMKYVFSDPKTGYTSDKSSEFSFTPIVQILDGLASKKA